MDAYEAVDLVYQTKIQSGLWTVTTDGKLYRKGEAPFGNDPVVGAVLYPIINGKPVRVCRRLLVLRHLLGSAYRERKADWILPNGEVVTHPYTTPQNTQDKAIAMLKALRPVATIAEELALTPYVVYDIARRNNIKTRGKMNRKLSEAARLRIGLLLAEGYTDGEIGEKFNVSRITIFKLSKRLRRAMRDARFELDSVQ